MIRHVDDYSWETRDGNNPGDDIVRWKLLVDADRTPGFGFSLGILEIPPGGVLPPHHHTPQEVYCIYRGTGKLRLGGEVREVKAGTIVFIPQDHVHGIENVGPTPLSLMWIFPTDAWADVEYEYL
ncbi:MAG: cupin domain-containing protein [Gammaproteobacteria bacterium]|nr:cupin domain-containing protein [Gammaproteobacteria bacterium]